MQSASLSALWYETKLLELSCLECKDKITQNILIQIYYKNSVQLLVFRHIW